MPNKLWHTWLKSIVKRLLVSYQSSAIRPTRKTQNTQKTPWTKYMPIEIKNNDAFKRLSIKT